MEEEGGRRGGRRRQLGRDRNRQGAFLALQHAMQRGTPASATTKRWRQVPTSQVRLLFEMKLCFLWQATTKGVCSLLRWMASLVCCAALTRVFDMRVCAYAGDHGLGEPGRRLRGGAAGGGRRQGPRRWLARARVRGGPGAALHSRNLIGLDQRTQEADAALLCSLTRRVLLDAECGLPGHTLADFWRYSQHLVVLLSQHGYAVNARVSAGHSERINPRASANRGGRVLWVHAGGHQVRRRAQNAIME